jgi:hypothetical protein
MKFDKPLPEGVLKKKSTMLDSFSKFIITIIAGFFLLITGIIFFVGTLWMVKLGAYVSGYTDIAANSLILAASIVSAAAIIGSSLQNNR